MKATEITIQILKNLGNFETVRLFATFTLDDGENLQEAFVNGRKELESSFKAAYLNEQVVERETLFLSSKKYPQVKLALENNVKSFSEIQQFFLISPEVFDEFKKLGLTR